MKLSPETLDLFSKYAAITDESIIRERAAAIRDAVLGRTGMYVYTIYMLHFFWGGPSLFYWSH